MSLNPQSGGGSKGGDAPPQNKRLETIWQELYEKSKTYYNDKIKNVQKLYFIRNVWKVLLRKHHVDASLARTIEADQIFSTFAYPLRDDQSYVELLAPLINDKFKNLIDGDPNVEESSYKSTVTYVYGHNPYREIIKLNNGFAAYKTNVLHAKYYVGTKLFVSGNDQQRLTDEEKQQIIQLEPFEWGDWNGEWNEMTELALALDNKFLGSFTDYKQSQIFKNQPTTNSFHVYAQGAVQYHNLELPEASAIRDVTYVDLKLPQIQPTTIRNDPDVQTWNEVQNRVTFKDKMQFLNGKGNSNDIQNFDSRAVRISNKTRLQLIDQGLDEFFQSQIQNLQDKKYIIPPFRLLNMILFYFYFDEPNRKMFLQQYMQLLMVCMARSQVVFMNYDIVEYSNLYYQIINDGLQNNPNKFQTHVLARQLDGSGQITDTNVELSVFEIKLVSGSEMERQYGFIFPQCQSNSAYRGMTQELQSVVQQTQQIQDEQNVLSSTTRIQLTLMYYQGALALSDILLSSFAHATNHGSFEYNKEVGGMIANISGGMKPLKRKLSHHNPLIGGVSWKEWFQQKLQTVQHFIGIPHVEPNILDTVQPQTNIGSLDGTSNARRKLPKIDIQNVLKIVTFIDQKRYVLQDDSPFLIPALYASRSPIDQISDDGLQGVSTNLQTLIKEWITTVHHDEFHKFEILWQLPPQGHAMREQKHIFNIIGVDTTQHTIDATAIDGKLKKLLANLDDVKAIVKTSMKLKETRGNKQSRRDYKFIDDLLRQCVSDTNPSMIQIYQDEQLMDALRENLQLFLDRAVAFMIAYINPKRPTTRATYIKCIIDIFLQLTFPQEAIDRSTIDNQDRGEWRWNDVQMYNANDFVRVKTLSDEFNTELNKYGQKHSQFRNALAQLNKLDITKDLRDPSVCTYSYVTMFLNVMDKIMARLGSTIALADGRLVFFTKMEANNVAIGFSKIGSQEFKDSIDSIKQFSYMDLYKTVQRIDEFRLPNPQFTMSWLAILEEFKRNFELVGLDQTSYRPCLKKVSDQWYYACTWNFPITILPILNVVQDKNAALFKLGCHECNMYAIEPENSFGVLPTVYQSALQRAKYFAQPLEDISNKKYVHYKTNYSMMFVEPLAYQMDMYLFYKDASQIVQNIQRGGGGRGSITKENLGMARIMMYTGLCGCHYVKRTWKRLEGGEEIDARTLEQVMHQKQPAGDLYPSLTNKYVYAQTFSSIVYSMFYFLVGILSVNAQYAMFIMPWYESVNVTKPKGKVLFAKEYWANKSRSRGFTIDRKLQDLGLQYPSQAQAQGQAAQNKTQAAQQGMSDSMRYLLSGVGLLTLYEGLKGCIKDTNRDLEDRTKCEIAKKAIDEGAKHKFKARPFKPRQWEESMKKFPLWFAKTEDGQWTDAEVLDPRVALRDRLGNKMDRFNKNYSSGMSFRQGNGDRFSGISNAERARYLDQKQAQLDDQLQGQARDVMIKRRQKEKIIGSKAEGARNLQFTNARGETVFRMLPHNIVANVLLLGYAGLTAWAASAGSSAYTRLLDIEKKKGCVNAADYLDLQKPRMACSFFFGMGLGIFVAFIASIVEMANHKRVRQALFVLLMAVPIIVLGVIGVSGSKNTCELNPESGKPQVSMGDSRFPRLSGFWKTLTGQHKIDLGDDSDCTNAADNTNDVLRFNVEASDYLFMGLGSGVLMAGICTLLPDNPFHPNKFDVAFQEGRSAKFDTVSQVNRKWWIYALLFTFVLGGAGGSSLWLTTADTGKINTKTANGVDVRQSSRIQSGISIGVAILLFIVILVVGEWHIKRQKKFGMIMEGFGSGRSNNQSTNKASGAYGY